MVICPVCGTNNSDSADFCTNCGTYLAWDREAQSRQPGGPVLQQPVAPQATTSHAGDPPTQPAVALVTERSEVQPSRQRRQPETPAAQPPEPRNRVDAANSATPNTLAAAAPDAPAVPESAAAQRTAAEQAKPSSPEPVKPGDPPPVKPGERVFTPAHEAPSPERPAPGDLVCPNCGTGNEPRRTYCRKCAHVLAGAITAPRRSWWRRHFGRRPRKARLAGSRPRRPLQFPTRTVALLVVVALSAGATYIFRDVVGWSIGRGLDEIGKFKVRPVDVTASSWVAGQEPLETRDLDSDTFWAPGPADPTGEYLEAEFAEPIRLVSVIVTPGASRTPEKFLAAGRPLRLRFTPIDSAGQDGEAREVDLDDSPGFQSFYVGMDDVKRLRIELVSVRLSEKPVAVAEVEYRARRGIMDQAPDPVRDPVPVP
jgi:ribosomal protein L40E